LLLLDNASIFDMKFLPRSRYSNSYRLDKPSNFVILLNDKFNFLNFVNDVKPSIVYIWLFDNVSSYNSVKFYRFYILYI
jgi:hypothetical protein